MKIPIPPYNDTDNPWHPGRIFALHLSKSQNTIELLPADTFQQSISFNVTHLSAFAAVKFTEIAFFAIWRNQDKITRVDYCIFTEDYESKAELPENCCIVPIVAIKDASFIDIGTF